MILALCLELSWVLLGGGVPFFCPADLGFLSDLPRLGDVSLDASVS